jgi:hypothetical protein
MCSPQTERSIDEHLVRPCTWAHRRVKILAATKGKEPSRNKASARRTFGADRASDWWEPSPSWLP